MGIEGSSEPIAGVIGTPFGASYPEIGTEAFKLYTASATIQRPNQSIRLSGLRLNAGNGS
jgi:hypothetical protein